MKRLILLSAIIFCSSLHATNVTPHTNTNLPEKIYAVMITGKDAFHKHLAENAILSFLQQTYPSKHLIIVNDGDGKF